MRPPKKTTTAFAPKSDKRPDQKPSVLARSPWLILGALIVLPLLGLLAFTFKSGYVPAPKGRADKIIVRQTPTELAEEATAVLRKGNNAAFFEFLDTKVRDINAANSSGNTLLLEAVNMGNEDAVGQLLSLGADVNRRNPFTRDTPIIRALDFAAEKKKKRPNLNLIARKIRIAGQLLYAGADANVENNYKQSPMGLAVENQVGELVNAFLSGGGVTVGVNKATLFRSVANKNLVGVVGMLKGGISPNIKNDKGNTPLIVAASIGDIPSVQNLMSYGADVNATNKNGDTALIYAARYNYPKVITELLRPYSLVAPLDVDMKNSRGETALYWAAARGNEEAVVRLLAAGADPSIATKAGVTPLQVAEKYKRSNIIPWFSASELEVKNRVIALDNAAAIAAAKKAGKPIPVLAQPVDDSAPEDLSNVNIFKTIASGDTALLTKLIRSNKAAVFEKDKATGFTPIHAAVKARQLQMVQILANNMANITDLSREGSVFHLAVKQQDIEMLQLLARLAKADNSLSRLLESKVAAPNKQMMTPLGFAALNCNKEIYDYLVSIGANPGKVSKESSMFGFYSPVELIRKCKQYRPSFRRMKQSTAKGAPASNKTTATTKTATAKPAASSAVKTKAAVKRTR